MEAVGRSCRDAIAACSAVPSSSIVHCSEDGQAVTVLANGSPFLYLLDTATAQLQAAVRCPCGVQYCTSLSPPVLSPPVLSPPVPPPPITSPLVLCCLRDGKVLVVNIFTALEKRQSNGGPGAADPTGDDVFASLLGAQTSNGSRRSQGYTVCNHDNMSTVLSVCHTPNWTPLCVGIHGNTLLLVLHNATTGECVIRVARQRGTDTLDGWTVPVFPDTLAAQQYTISTSNPHTSRDSCQGYGAPVLIYRPCLLTVQCVGDDLPSSIHKDFFLQLFGPEAMLASSPVLLISSSTGDVSFVSVRQLEYLDKNTSLKSLCCLEQPVVGIHTVELPMEDRDTTCDPLVERGGEGGGGAERELEGKANALLVVGQRGKIIVWRMSDPSRSFAAFSEFHVPGPILSSVLVPGHSLIYSTLRGCYRICLRPQCQARPLTSPDTTGPVRLPELAFRSPSLLSPSVGFLLPSAPLTPSTHHRPSPGVVSVSPCGRISWLAAGSDQDSPEPLTASQAAQNLKQSLTSIEATSRQVDLHREKILAVNGSLAELNAALTLLCEVADTTREVTSSIHGRRRPFHCQLTPCFDLVGVTGRTPCVRVQLQYEAGRKPLGDGWSLIVHIYPGDHSQENPSRGEASKVMPLSGMPGGGRVEVVVELGPLLLRPLACEVQCSLHYSTSGLLSTTALQYGSGAPHCHNTRLKHSTTGPGSVGLDTSRALKSDGAAVALCSTSFNVLDFLEPALQPSSADHRGLVSSEDISSLLVSREVHLSHRHTSLVHSLDLPVPTAAVQRLVSPTAVSSHPVTTPLLSSLLSSLLPFCAHITATGQASEVAMTGYDGFPIHLRASQPDSSDGRVILTVMAAHRAMLTELCGALRKKLWPSGRSCDRSHDQLCRQLHSLEKLSRRSSELLDEAAGGSGAGAEPGEHLFQLYCDLRQ